MPVAPVAVGDAAKPFSVVSQQTQWRRLFASDIESEVDPNTLKTSIADSDTEIEFRGSVSGAAITNVDDCYIALWDLVDPDTGEGVDWAGGEYIGVDVWFKFGSNDITAAAKSACFVGVYGPSNTVLSAGMFQTAGGTFLASALYGSADRNGTTLTSDSVIYGNINVAPDDDATNVNVLWNYGSAYQFDDATTPGRLQSCLAGALIATTGADIKIMMALAGDIDVAAYYRLIKVPNNPTVSLSGN